jgi:hypothetical protein
MPFPTYGETILLMYQKKIEDLFGFRLVPTYSYGRTYERHARLLSHTDRPSCEIIRSQEEPRRIRQAPALDDAEQAGGRYASG